MRNTDDDGAPKLLNKVEAVGANGWHCSYAPYCEPASWPRGGMRHARKVLKQMGKSLTSSRTPSSLAKRIIYHMLLACTWPTGGLTHWPACAVASCRISVSLSIDTFAAALGNGNGNDLSCISHRSTFWPNRKRELVLWPCGSGSCLLLSLCFNVAASQRTVHVWHFVYSPRAQLVAN